MSARTLRRQLERRADAALGRALCRLAGTALDASPANTVIFVRELAPPAVVNRLEASIILAALGVESMLAEIDAARPGLMMVPAVIFVGDRATVAWLDTAWPAIGGAA